MTMHRRLLTALASAFLLSGAQAALAMTAQAAPQGANTFTLDVTCSDGNDYEVTLVDTAPDRAAVHVVGATTVLVPTAFQWHVVVTDDEGVVLDESTSSLEPVHGRSVERLDTVECTFSQVAHHETDSGPMTITVDGTVWAHKPG